MQEKSPENNITTSTQNAQQAFFPKISFFPHQVSLILLRVIVIYIFFMQNQTTRSAIRSSFHKKRSNELANYLVSEMGMEAELAHLFIRIHGPTNITEVLNLFLVDQNGTINHAFIPQEEHEELCKVCDATSPLHRNISIERITEQLQRQKEDLSSQIAIMDDSESIQSRHACEICYIQFAKSDMLQIKGVMHTICLQCMGSYIRQEISNMRVEKISCPHCGVFLAQDLIRDLTDVATFNKYKLFIRNLEIQKSPNLKWCPNSKCSVVVSTNPDKKTSKCPKCATEICNKCNRQAHPRSSCQGAFRKQIQDWQNASDIQKCKKCQGLVQKIAGCNHMTCSICHFQWCWLCGSDYSTAHFSALNPFGCPGLQDRPRDDWGKCKILLLRIGLLFLFIIGVPVILPVAMIVCGPVLIGNLFWNCIYPDNFCKKFGIVIISIILGIIANPIVWIGSMVYFIPKGIQKLYYWYLQRKQNQQRRANFLQERLLGEQVFEERSLANQ